MLALYLLTLGASAAVAGVFTHQLLAAFGYASGYEVGMLLVGVGASGYLVFQLGFMAVLSLIKPWRGKKLWLMESLSHAAVLVLIPSLMRVQIPWPHELLDEFEPLIYLAAFLLFYAIARLLVFFTVLQCVSGLRMWALAWSAAAGIAFLLASGFGSNWVDAMEDARPHAPETVAGLQAGGQHAQARQVPEGSLVEHEIEDFPGMSLSLRVANLPDIPAQNRMDTIHVQVRVQGKAQSRRVAREVRLTGDGWATMRIAADEMPENPVSCNVSWTWEKEPAWRSMTGLRPVIGSGREVLMSGPFCHAERDGREHPNIIVIAVEGLGQDHMSRGGYERPTTPELDKLAWASQTFASAMTPVPEAAGACMSLMTGLVPLRHGYLGKKNGPLPEDTRTLAEILQSLHYATAAFTESDAAGDMGVGSEFERGFELFDTVFTKETARAEVTPDFDVPDEDFALTEGQELLDADLDTDLAPATVGSVATLERARAWVDAHRDVRFFAFIRLRELRDLALHERYGTPFVSKGQEMPGPRDIYDTALTYLDQHTGAFVQYVRGQETRANTLIVVTSPYGFDFSAGNDALPRVGLSETCLRVPLIVYAQWLRNEARVDLASLEDVAPSLLGQVGAPFGDTVDGQDFLGGPTGTLPVSVFGDPLDMTMRGPDHRLYWSSGYSPFSGPASQPEAPKLYLMRDINRGRYVQDHAVRNRDLISRWRTQMATQLERHARDWGVQPPP